MIQYFKSIDANTLASPIEVAGDEDTAIDIFGAGNFLAINLPDDTPLETIDTALSAGEIVSTPPVVPPVETWLVAWALAQNELFDTDPKGIATGTDLWKRAVRFNRLGRMDSAAKTAIQTAYGL